MSGFKGEPRAAQMETRRRGTNDGTNDFLCGIEEGRKYLSLLVGALRFELGEQPSSHVFQQTL